MPAAPDSPGKTRLQANTPSLSDRIAALQRRNVSGPAAVPGQPTPSSSTDSALSAAQSSSLLSPPERSSAGGGANSGSGAGSSAVKDRIARLQSRGDGETPLLPRSSFGAPAPNPDVASHALRQFPGAALGPAQGGTLRPQMTGGAWLNGMPAANTGGPLRPQMTGGMWGNQYYGAHSTVPLPPRRGPSPTTPTRQHTQPVIRGGGDDAFAELDREAEAARAAAAAAGSTSIDSSTNEPTPILPSAPNTALRSPDDASPPSETKAALPVLPEPPADPPQFTMREHPASPPPLLPNGAQLHPSTEIEVGMRAPADNPAARRRLDELVAAAQDMRVLDDAGAGSTAESTPTLASGFAGGASTDSPKRSTGTAVRRTHNPLYTDITDDDDRLQVGGDAEQYGTLTVLRRSRTGSSSAVSDGLHGVGRAAVDALLGDASASEDEDVDRPAPAGASAAGAATTSRPSTARTDSVNSTSRDAPPQQLQHEQGSGGGSTDDGRMALNRKKRGGMIHARASPSPVVGFPASPTELGDPEASWGRLAAGTSNVSSSAAAGREATAVRNGSSSHANGIALFGSPVRSGSGARTASPTAAMQHTPPGARSSAAAVNGAQWSTSPVSSAGSGSHPLGLPSSDSAESGFTITQTRARAAAPGAVASPERYSARQASVSSMSSGSGGLPRRSGSVASSGTAQSGYDGGSGSGRRQASAGSGLPESIAEGGHPAYASSSSSATSPSHGREGSTSSSSMGAPGGVDAAARAREAIALARSKSQGGRLARPPPPGRTLTAAELDASDDDYEPGWASIISRK